MTVWETLKFHARQLQILVRNDLGVPFNPVLAKGQLVCAVQCIFECVTILFTSIYMPYESDNDSDDNFSVQLSIINDHMERNSDPYISGSVEAILKWASSEVGTPILCKNALCNNISLYSAAIRRILAKGCTTYVQF
jgi:hypothetical protein